MLEFLQKGDARVLSHGEDLDGLFSASLVLAVVEEARLRFMAPYESKVSQERFDVTLDLPPTQGGTHLLVDHHESNLELAYRAEIPIIRPEYPSTARLLYEILLEEEPSLEEYANTVSLVDDLDTGRINYPGALFTAVLRKYFKEDRSKLNRVAYELLKVRPTREEDLLAMRTIRSEAALIEREYGEALERITKLEGGEGIVLMVKGLPAYLVPVIQLPAKKYLILVTVTQGRDGKYRLSIRSRGNSPISALELAKRFGGGGHENAAGALIMPSSLSELIDILATSVKLEVLDV